MTCTLNRGAKTYNDLRHFLHHVAAAAFRYPALKPLTPPALCAGGVIHRTKIWHRAILPGPCGPSIVAAVGLNYRVRNGNGWIPHAIGARNC